MDSAVANLAYQTPSLNGRTNAAGEFRYVEGETITFIIGGITLPPIEAKASITPLDIFNAQELNDTRVVNLSRLLQTLDEDNLPDNGIVIRSGAYDIPANTYIEFNDVSLFEQTSLSALASAGIDAPLTGYGRALTHLANSLVSQDLASLSDVTNGSLQSDPDGTERQLADLDDDGVADNYDAFPDDPAESYDFDEDGIGDNADLDDDNDGTPDTTDLYPNNAYYGDDTDGDGWEDQYDYDDDNDGVYDTQDAFPKDPLETEDLDGDGIGNNSDPDDDGDGVADIDDPAPLDARCSLPEDTAGGVCIETFVDDMDIVAAVGSTAYLFNSAYSAVVPMDLATAELLPAIEIDSHSTEGTTVSAAVYHETHDKIYIGFHPALSCLLHPVHCRATISTPSLTPHRFWHLPVTT